MAGGAGSRRKNVGVLQQRRQQLGHTQVDPVDLHRTRVKHTYHLYLKRPAMVLIGFSPGGPAVSPEPPALRPSPEQQPGLWRVSEPATGPEPPLRRSGPGWQPSSETERRSFWRRLWPHQNHSQQRVQ